MYQTKSSRNLQNFLSKSLPNKDVAREIRETVKSKSMRTVNPRIDY